MTERTGSANPDRELTASDVVELLAGQPMAAGVLALCSAERLSAVAESLVSAPLAARAVRTGLDVAWSAVVAGHERFPDLIGDELGKAISDLYELLGSERNDVPQFQGELDNTMCSALYALEAVRDGSPAAAANAVDYCRNFYFQLAVHTWPRLDVDAWINSPVVQGEVRREISEARAIAAWGGVISAERADRLRRAAQADGEILVNLIRGGSEEPDKGPAASGQEPLF
jgi:hypothetical protein